MPNTPQQERTTDAVSLLPCPFCGKQPTENTCDSVDHTKKSRTIVKGHYLSCCFGDFEASPSGYDGCAESILSREELAQRWNTRPAMSQQAAPARPKEVQGVMDIYVRQPSQYSWGRAQIQDLLAYITTLEQAAPQGDSPQPTYDKIKVKRGARLRYEEETGIWWVEPN